jgi:hypothetical protein
MLQSRKTFALISGGLVGIVLFGLVRLLFLPSIAPVHYHANWAVWIDGDRVDLSGSGYMEDVAACGADVANITGPQRVHMHENNHDVVHVHHQGATWGHLLQNLGWGIGSDWLYTDEGVLHREEGGRRLTFVLNGTLVPPAHNRVIGRGDRMLISFGAEDSEQLLRDQFPSVTEDAPAFDEGFDPAGCQGNASETFGDRIRRAFWF